MTSNWIKLRRDYKLHFFAGLGLAIIIGVACHMFAPSYAIAVVVLGVGGIGWGKEIIHDCFLKKGTPEYADALITWAGCLPVVVLLEFLML
ncbi:MAG: hypothetical protein JKY93_03410 [Gammaproteobacteria bacterium]|nr:hypothetical protein [Gammaproteobacteria bacterium]